MSKYFRKMINSLAQNVINFPHHIKDIDIKRRILMSFFLMILEIKNLGELRFKRQ